MNCSGAFTLPFLIACLVLLQFSLATDDIPHFLVEPQSVVVQPGMSVELWCSVSPNSTTVRWLLNGSVISSQRPRGVELREGSLKIADFNELNDVSHEGVYQCLASSPYGTIMSSEARVEEAVLHPSDSTQTVAEITVIRGNVAVVPCYPPFSRPQATIEFELNGTRLLLTDRHMILPSGNLQISNSSQQDRGMYQCSAYNPTLGKRMAASVVQKLTVGAPLANVTPTFIWSSREFVTVVFGQNLTLECAAEGWPVPELTWAKYGGHLPTGRYSMVLGNLVIQQVQKFDAGTYLCRASNGIGQPQAKVISVEILEPPLIETLPVSRTVTEGSTVQFICGARGTPKVTTHWLYNGNAMSSNNQFITVRDSTLILTHVQQHQSGMYQCVAKNGLGMSHASAHLTVTESSGVGADEDEGDEDEAAERQRPDRKGDDLDETGHTGEHIRHRGQLIAPSKPEVVKLSDTSVLVQWTILPPTGSHTITGFKLQFKELVDEGTALWRTVGEEISPSQRLHELARLKPGSMYRFRVGAVFSNNESKYGPSSNKVTMTGPPTSAQPRIPTLPAPVIVELRPLSVGEIFIGWQQLEADQWPIDGFYIYYLPHGDSAEYLKKVVKGASVRHAVLSHLNPGTSYRIRMQSFSVVAGESEFSSTFVKDTLSYSGDLPMQPSGDGKSDSSSDKHGKIYPSDHGANRNVQVKKDDRMPGPDDPDLNDVEEYMPNGAGGHSESQLLYVALGVVFGLVALVTVICIIMCMVKQHRQQQTLACAKERMKLQEGEQTAAFLGTMTLKPGAAETSEGGQAVGATAATTHVPGCNGGCSAASLNVTDGGGIMRENLPLPARNYDGMICSANGKTMPELLLPPPPPLANASTPKNYKGSYCDNGTGSEQSLVCQQNPASRCTGHIYSKLQDQDTSSKSSTHSCDRAPAKMHGHLSSGHFGVPQHLSPDHIPRSYEHHQPYLEQVRRSQNAGGRPSPENRYPQHQSSLQNSSRNNPGWRREEMPIEEENMMRDQATNTDLLSSNDVFSLYNESDCNHYSSLERRGSHDSINTFSPGTSVVRDSFISVDSQESGVPPFGSVGFPMGGDGFLGNRGRCFDNRCNAGHQTGYHSRAPPPMEGFRDSQRHQPDDVPEGRYNLGSGLMNLGPVASAVASPRSQNYPGFNSDGYR